MKQAIRGGLGATLGVLLFAVLAVANYLSARHLFHRFDLTRNKEFTVAPATRNVLAGLDDVVNVKVYFSKNLPEQAAVIPARVRDLLAEYEAYGKGKIKVEEIDPQSSPEMEQKVRSMGIPRIPLAVLEKHKQQTIEVYLGLAVLYADQKEVIPAVLDDGNLEYELTRAVLKVTQPKKKLAFATGHEEHDVFRDYRALGERLRQQFEVQPIDLAAGAPIGEDVTTLIVAGPRKPLDDHARFAIDQFLMRGGRALFLVDMFDVDPGQLMTRPVDSGLVEQIASYGVRIKPALAADWASNETVQVPGGQNFGGMQMSYVVPYPLWVKVGVDGLSESHPVVNQLSGLALPWTAPLEVVTGSDKKGTVTELASTTRYGSVEDKLFTANPRSLQPPAKDQMKPVLLAAAITGPLKSYFAGKPEPTPAPPPAAEEGAPPPTPTPVPAPAPPRKDEVADTQILVVGSSEFATDAMLRQRPFLVNAVFFQNAVDWLTIGEGLIGIRSRLGAERTLDADKLEIGQQVAPYLSLVFVPGMVVVFGMLWRAARRRRRVVLA